MMRSTYVRASSILARAAGAIRTCAPSWATARACSRVRLSPSMTTVFMRDRLSFLRSEGLDRAFQRVGHLGRQIRHLMFGQDVLSLRAGPRAQVQRPACLPTVTPVAVEDGGTPLYFAHVPVGVVACHEVATGAHLGDGVHGQ